MKEQHNQKKLAIYVTLLIVVICLFGISFALFKFNASQATQNDITTLNCFEVEYSDVTDAITITNDFPISDAEGLKRTPYTFKIKNKCSQLLNVQIGVETLSTSQIQPNLIKGVITKKGETPTSAKLLSAGIPGTPVNGGTNYILLEDTIYGSQEKEYDLRLWFTESMTKEQGSGKTYQGKVTVISSPKIDKTVYGQVLADYNRNIVEKTTDENGKTIYYYSRTLDEYSVDANNNIVLNNFCWRMVRTTETDGVKLLYNGIYSNDTKCNNKKSNRFIDTLSTEFNLKSNSPAYAGYMYGTIYELNAKTISTDYYFGSDVTWDGKVYTLINAESLSDATNEKHYTCFSTNTQCNEVYYIYNRNQSFVDDYITLTSGKKIADALNEMLDYNTTNSNIKTVIDNWYKEKMTNVTSYLENAIYCNNRHVNEYSGWNPRGNLAFKVSNPIFDDYKEARFTCQDQEDQFTLKAEAGGAYGYGNNALDYPIGLLTEKEIQLTASGNMMVLDLDNLIWTMSPGYIYRGDVTVISRENSKGANTTPPYTKVGVRPAISLKQNVIITGGTGEIENPYTVALPN